MPYGMPKRAAASRPLWVKSRHSPTLGRCLLYPQKQTSFSTVAMSALCQKPTRRICPSLWRHEDCWEDSVYQHRNGGDRNDVTEQTEHTVKGTEGVEGRLCNA